MEIKRRMSAYLGQYYKELFFGTANKRYRSMTGADLKQPLKSFKPGDFKRGGKAK